MGRTTHPKTGVVVTVVGGVIVAVGRVRVVWIVDPRAAAQHTPLSLREPHWKSQQYYYDH